MRIYFNVSKLNIDMVQLVTDHSPAAAIEMPNINVSDSFTFTHRGHSHTTCSQWSPVHSGGVGSGGAYHSVRRGLLQAL